MDAQQLRDAIAAIIAQYDAELTPPPPPPPPEIPVPAGADLQAAIGAAPDGAVLALEAGAEWTGNFTLPRPVTVAGGGRIFSPNSSPALTITGSDVTVGGTFVSAVAGAPTNDLVIVTGSRVPFIDCVIRGNGSTKRGIQGNGSDILVLRTRIEKIGRIGQESQAFATWDGTRITIRDSFLEAGSIPFLSGGAKPTVPNHVPEDILIEDCVLTHPMEWRGLGYANKNAFEVKSGRRVTVRNCILENVWKDAQVGMAVQLTPSQYGNSPENIVEDVRFEGNTFRNVGGCLNVLGLSQSQAEFPCLRTRNITFTGNTVTIDYVTYGGNGTLLQMGAGPENVHLTNNNVLTNGTAFLRSNDLTPIPGLIFTGNTVNVAGTYGVFISGNGSRGTNFYQVFPDGVIQGCTFTDAHSIFKANFPDNTYLTSGV